jgi:hypothetical protein
LPVAISALLWVVCALFVITVPGEAFVPDLIVVGLIVAGGLYFLGLFKFHREVLETEPGDVGVDGHSSGRVPDGRHVVGDNGSDGLLIREKDRTSRPLLPSSLEGGGPTA